LNRVKIGTKAYNFHQKYKNKAYLMEMEQIRSGFAGDGADPFCFW